MVKYRRLERTNANKNALNDVIQKWFKDSKYDFGTALTEYSPEHQNIFIKEWSNKFPL